MQSAIDRAISIAGGQDALAKLVGVTQSLVSQWRRGATSIHPRHFLFIERATKGQVKRAELLNEQIARHLTQRRA